MKICPRCKMKNGDDAVYCKTCTFPLHDAEIVPEEAPQKNAVPVPADEGGIRAAEAAEQTAAAVKAERERVSAILSICNGEFPEIEKEAIRDDWTPEIVMRKLLEETRKAKAEAAKEVEIVRGQEEARIAAEEAAPDEAARLAREQELARTTVVCSKCQKRYDKTLKFCPDCGEINASLISFFCSKCGKEASSSVKICQNCGGRVVKDDPLWLQNMLEIQKTIPYPAKKVCDVNIKPGYFSAVALSDYMKNHLGYFFKKVEVEDGLVFTGRTAIETPANEEEIRCGHPRTKKVLSRAFLSLYFRINLNKDGIPENYSLYLKTENSKYPPLWERLLRFILMPLSWVLSLAATPLIILFMPDSAEEVVLETMNFSKIPNSLTSKITIKKHETFVLLALYLGFLGVHDFYVGKKWQGVVHFLLTIPLGIFIIPAGISLLWAWWEIVSEDTAVETIWR